LPAEIKEFALGNYTFWHVQVGTLRLDGGAMFGVVPKTLWSRTYSADDLNRITLGTNVLIFQGNGTAGIIDNGTGNKDSGKFKNIYEIQWLGFPWRDLPVRMADIRWMLLTHLHFDHCGGSTMKEPNGAVVPTFAHARHVVHKIEFDDAAEPNERSQASYLSDNFIPLQNAKILTLLDRDEIEVTKDVHAIRTPGHTRGHLVYTIDTGDGIVAFLADFIPTSRHVGLPYIMAYDLYPMDSLASRRRLYPRMVEENWLCVFEHDEKPRAGYLRAKGRDYTVEPFYG
jgi:glyoxylase-like metal-dependent hydrolase (beta-lactamase superfamily II)